MRDSDRRYPPQTPYHGYGVEKKFCKGRCQTETDHFQGVTWENGASEKQITCVVCGHTEKNPIPWEECVRLAPRAALKTLDT